jgi:hypothetical protein
MATPLKDEGGDSSVAPGEVRATVTGPVVPATPPRPPAPPGHGLRTGTIDRTALLRTLDAGPGNLLRAIEVSPFFEGARFRGWRLDQIVDGSSPVAIADLRAGDVVIAINQRPIARPEHVMALWKELRAADELVCQVWRDQTAFELHFAITPPALPPARSATRSPSSNAPAGAPVKP